MGTPQVLLEPPGINRAITSFTVQGGYQINKPLNGYSGTTIEKAKHRKKNSNITGSMTGSRYCDFTQNGMHLHYHTSVKGSIAALSSMLAAATLSFLSLVNHLLLLLFHSLSRCSTHTPRVKTL